MRAFNPNGVSDLQILCTVLETCSRENFGIAPGSTEPQAEAVCALALEKIRKIIGQSLESSDHPLVDEVPNIVQLAVALREGLLEPIEASRSLFAMFERSSGLSPDQMTSMVASAEEMARGFRDAQQITKIEPGPAPRGVTPIVTTMSGGA